MAPASLLEPRSRVEEEAFPGLQHADCLTPTTGPGTELSSVLSQTSATVVPIGRLMWYLREEAVASPQGRGRHSKGS